MPFDPIDSRMFSHAAENLGYYVYALVDPETGIPFYIGKGVRTRAADHGIEATFLSNDAKGSQKIDEIRRIRVEQDREPEIWILQHPLTREVYGLVESAMIDFVRKFPTTPLANRTSDEPQLTNKMRGSNSANGIIELTEFIAQHAVEPLVTELPLLLVRLGQWVTLDEDLPGGGIRTGYGFRPEWTLVETRVQHLDQIGDSIRAWWTSGPSLPSIEQRKVKHAVAVWGNVTRAVFAIVPDSFEYLQRDYNGEVRNHTGFRVTPITSGPVFDEVVGRYGRILPQRTNRGKERPWRYWPYPATSTDEPSH